MQNSRKQASRGRRFAVRNAGMLIAAAIALFLALSFFLIPDFFSLKYDSRAAVAEVASSSGSQEVRHEPVQDGSGHVLSPSSVKALYMTSWVAGSPDIRGHILGLLDTTEANAVVIDIKDYTGMISFETGDPDLDGSGCIERRIRDLPDLIAGLHAKGIYVIGRVAVFQDPCYVKNHPEVAVKRKSDGAVWKDDKGLAWVDMGSEDAWAYAVKIAKASHALGFDEINFDYVRFPSDGNMKDISFVSGNIPKPEVFRNFFEYLDKELRGGKATYEAPVPQIVKTVGQNSMSSSSTASPATPVNISGTAKDPAFDAHFDLISGTSSAAVKARQAKISAGRGEDRVITSADLFGMVTTNKDDLGIGQVLENALPYVDYVYPMVYPSHYPPTWNGFKNPAANPYEVIQISMSAAMARARAQGLNPLKLRPWLQDFDMGATYTAEMVRKQIQATYDIGLTGWLLWDASNKYTPAALRAK